LKEGFKVKENGFFELDNMATPEYLVLQYQKDTNDNQVVATNFWMNLPYERQFTSFSSSFSVSFSNALIETQKVVLKRVYSC